jgi:predicted nucleic acid-binding protein
VRYLPDTNIISRQDSAPRIRTWVLQHYLNSAVSAPSIAEFAAGIEGLPAGPKRAKYAAQLQEVLSHYEVLDFGVKEAQEWGRYVHSVGRPVSVMDSLIAAVALAHGLEVVTENVKDFPGVPTVNPLKL